MFTYIVYTIEELSNKFGQKEWKYFTENPINENVYVLVKMIFLLKTWTVQFS